MSRALALLSLASCAEPAMPLDVACSEQAALYYRLTASPVTTWWQSLCGQGRSWVLEADQQTCLAAIIAEVAPDHTAWPATCVALWADSYEGKP